eukprot:TRINITY_DN4043_c0_g2_i13.p1 TRINITY_DN4043_c0_g2~~TRINITY_DN4043_c0_g2_i13.p1  ORF type:complete len:278 (-),score=56.67 TRINITY_DN4043_c0_g2_i13:1452-2285(-)
MAFWINIYNYLVVRVIRENPCATDAFGVCRPISSIIEIGVQQPSSFVSPVWKKPVLHIRSLQEEGMSIEDVEEKLKNPPFPGPKDPRIIACLACSTISCADIRGSAYSVANLDAEMTESTNFFLSNEEKGLRVVRRANNTLLVSQLFRIYQSYFAEAFNESTFIGFLKKYSPPQVKMAIEGIRSPYIYYFAFNRKLNGDVDSLCKNLRTCCPWWALVTLSLWILVVMIAVIFYIIKMRNRQEEKRALTQSSGNNNPDGDVGGGGGGGGGRSDGIWGW